MGLSDETKRFLRQDLVLLEKQIQQLELDARAIRALVGDFPPKGLGEAILFVLCGESDGLKPKEITERLSAAGLTSTTRTSLNAKVGAECWRMARAEHPTLRRTFGRRYLVVNSDAPHEVKP